MILVELPPFFRFWCLFLVAKAEYAALAIIIGAKEFVRKENIKTHPSYYLLGTLINLSVAVVSALVAGRVVGAIR